MATQKSLMLYDNIERIVNVCMLNLMQEVNKVIGVGLSRQLGWKTDLKNPQLEVNLIAL